MMSIDVNPVADRVRAVGDGRLNLRINPVNGLALTDELLDPGTPVIAGIAYLNPFVGGTPATLHDYEHNADQLMIQNPPNNGTLTPVGATSGVSAASVDEVGFDITATNQALLSAHVGAESRSL